MWMRGSRAALEAYILDYPLSTGRTGLWGRGGLKFNGLWTIFLINTFGYLSTLSQQLIDSSHPQ